MILIRRFAASPILSVCHVLGLSTRLVLYHRRRALRLCRCTSLSITNGLCSCQVEADYKARDKAQFQMINTEKAFQRNKERVSKLFAQFEVADRAGLLLSSAAPL